jgi:hypothetical protein
MDSLFSFPVGLFHPLQHAGLARRTPDGPSPDHNSETIVLVAQALTTTEALSGDAYLLDTDTVESQLVPGAGNKIRN